MFWELIVFRMDNARAGATEVQRRTVATIHRFDREAAGTVMGPLQA
jgi:hypothetical protein